ncbi:MAG: hypothetical protein AAF530_09085 [Pseudomonadota bacterium]
MSGRLSIGNWGLAFLFLLAAALLVGGPAAAQTATDLNCAGCVSTRNIAPGAVNASRLEDEAVTNRKIRSRGIRSGSLASDSVTNRVLAPDAVFMQTIVVRPEGPNAQDNCTDLIQALDSITDSSPTNPFLVIVEPGRYDCGNRTVRTKRYVDIQGSGEGITRIRGNRNSENQGVVELVSPSELRSITVENLGGSQFQPVIAISGVGERTSLRSVTAIAPANLSTVNSAVLARADSFMSVRDSRVISGQVAFFAQQNARINVVNTEIATPFDPDNAFGDVACLNAYDENLFLLNSACQ